MKKGFTLIELLAVIAILALLVVLAVPRVLKLFEEAKKNTFKIEAQNIVKAAEQGYALQLLNGSIEETTITYIEGEATKTGNIPLNLSGRNIQNGVINISKSGDTSFAISDGTHCAIKNIYDEQIIVEEKKEEFCALGTPDVCFTISGNAIIDYDHLNPLCGDEVVISKLIKNQTINTINANAFKNKQLKKVVISEGIIEIKENAFQDNQITKVYFPDSLTLIGAYAFQNNNIGNINIPHNLTIIGNNAFANNLIEILVIPNNIIDLGESAFADNFITDLTLSNQITNIKYCAFAWNRIENLSIPSSVTTIGVSAFQQNYLTNIVIPSNVTNIGSSAFKYNHIVEGGVIIKNVPSNVTVGADAFNYNDWDWTLDVEIFWDPD